MWVRSVVTAHCIAPPYIVPIKFTNTPTTLCKWNIKPKTVYNFIYSYVFQKHLRSFSILVAIHLFILSHDEIKDFCSMDKKTGRRYVLCIRISTKIIKITFITMFLFSQLYMHVYAFVAGWHTLWRKEQRCPPAHFCVSGICIITNNVVFIKYRNKNYYNL